MSHDHAIEFEVENAGVVLLAPFFPKLWEGCGFTRDGVLVDEAAPPRAVRVLHLLSHGEAPPDERTFPLCRFLAGLPLEFAQPIPVSLNAEERRLAESLLQHVVQQWPGGGTVSVAGLQTSFLMRRGLLARRDGAWKLKVERHAVDALLALLPWAFTPVRARWMIQSLQVEWV